MLMPYQIKNLIPKHFGRLNIKLSELHRKTDGLSWPTVAGLAGEQAPDYLPKKTEIDTLVQLSRALGCSVNDLIEVEEVGK